MDAIVGTSTNWRNDPAGRISNISLAPNQKNSLFPLFEAIMNSIQAIEERFGRDQISSGHVRVTVIRSGDGDCIGFTVSDNGIGFNQQNLDSFIKMDSQKKASIGGKGVGRLLWLKVADSVRIESIFSDAEAVSRVTFDFCLDDPIRNLEYSTGAAAEHIGTSIDLFPYKDAYARSIPRKAATIASRVLAHFISYFVNISQPKIEIVDGDNNIDLFDQFTSVTERDQDFRFPLTLSEGEFEFVCHCFLLPKSISDDEKSTNALYLGANGRAVRRYELDAVLGMTAIDGKYAYLSYVESEILNDTANDTRTEFSLSDDDLELIVNAAKVKAREFLAPEITEIRKRQEKVVASLRVEHPRFLSVARDSKEFADNLHLSMQKEEDVFVELSRQSLRQYKRRKNAFLTSVKKKLPDITAKAQEYVAGLQSESVSSLAEYVMKRKMILEVFEESLKYTDIEAKLSDYEDVVHDIVCPLRSTSEELDYEDHNLWIVDDRLAFFSYFNSDKQMKAQIANPPNPNDRPDISVFDISLGFQNIDQSQPITIIEFKRPKRDDYTLEKNPITQVRKYVEDMRKSGEAIKYDGTPLRQIADTTPFVCHIIADVTPSLRTVMKALGPFHQKVGSGTWYRWDDAFSIFIEISSFKDVLDSAKLRNKAFFEKIGLM
ncbi:ATP-binding protein [Rhodopseudomonas sp. BR0G17]|uniref:ATP-binding protein n=1 Tax=Rhodopseudomonas sp. BR0G17 TaxID=2269368 RepID=UPI0013E0A594|nr:ATP-binding protein [Rhodopseudomonas sp. BR0G17]NEW98623.1 ATP-binding protein [Rhodopseudomonas sp. BR0G17]